MHGPQAREDKEMKNHWIVRDALTAALGIAFLAKGMPAARAVEDPSLLIGRWRGFYGSVEDPNLRGGALVQVFEVRNRRFWADMLAPFELPIDGTLAASGRFEASGKRGNEKLLLRGAVDLFRD